MVESGKDIILQSGKDIILQDQRFVDIYNLVQPFTMTSMARVYALYSAIRYVVRAGIEGDIVECGVWRGGSMMAAAMTLRCMGREDRRLHLFDTFEGMPPPGEQDVALDGCKADDYLRSHEKSEDDPVWAVAGLESVKSYLALTGYPEDKLCFVPGRVEETIPAQAPDKIALLRLDTDWYESTLHELVHLFPRLAPGGVLIIDDYGHWQGARQAVDEYFTHSGHHILLSRIDYSGRMGVKA